METTPKKLKSRYVLPVGLLVIIVFFLYDSKLLVLTTKFTSSDVIRSSDHGGGTEGSNFRCCTFAFISKTITEITENRIVIQLIEASHYHRRTSFCVYIYIYEIG